MVEELKTCVDVDAYAKEFGYDARKVCDIMPIIAPPFLVERYSGIWVLKPNSNTQARNVIESITTLHGSEDEKNIFSVECLEPMFTSEQNDGFCIEFIKDLEFGSRKPSSFSSSFSSSTSSSPSTSSSSIPTGQNNVQDYNSFF